MESEWLEKDNDDGDKEEKEAEDTAELAVFRRQWQEELRCNRHTHHMRQEEREKEAATLYWMGVAAEKSGDMHSALLYYRHAVQLVPDIEYKVHSEDRPQHMREEGVDSSEEEEEETGGHNEGGVATLTEQFHYMTLHRPVCQPDRPSKGSHISVLPREVVRLILRWVVSAHLNMRSLEQCSMVCRGFYCLAREPGIWRTACRKLWSNCSMSSVYENSWRQMYITRPHLYFHGVYISKISYVRSGEHSLDGYYKPYHTVVYYRYLRFFPDGVVMYHTSADDPAHVVSRLCHKHSSESVLLGEYSMDTNKLTVDVLGYQSRRVPHGRQRARERKEITHEQRFHMELIVKSARKCRLFNQLVWQEHYCHSLHRPTGHVQASHFLIDYKYPPFLFSRVKSFTSSSRGVL